MTTTGAWGFDASGGLYCSTCDGETHITCPTCLGDTCDCNDCDVCDDPDTECDDCDNTGTIHCPTCES